jgi:TrmH RNA methyltransferase
MSSPDKPKPRFPHPPRHEDERPRYREDTDAPSVPQDKLAKIAGFQAVSALFRNDPSLVMRLYYNEKMKKAVGEFCAQMAKRQRPYRLVEDSELQKVSGTVLHGGVVAAVSLRAPLAFDLEQAKRWARAGEPLLILDGIGNPHNLGAIARTMAYFGLKHLLLSDHPGQAGLSDAAYRIAEGGLEHIAVYRVSELPQVFQQLREFYRVVGTSLSRKAVDFTALPYDPRPLALVLGNEENGLSAETLEACEWAAVIRGSGQVQSLNVSASAAILIQHMAAQGHEQTTTRTDANRQKPNPRPWKARSGGKS